MRELSLFTGAGGGILASHLLEWRTVGAVEIDKYCCHVLVTRQKEGHLDDFPIWNMDIREFNNRVARTYLGLVDVVSAGFPCQPFSVAGQQRAADDDRNMWPATIECIRIVRPRYCFLENVPGLLSRKHRYFEEILKDLAESGYDVRWKVISAAEVGAPHKRDRLWIVAKSADGLRWQDRQSVDRSKEEDETKTQGWKIWQGDGCTWNDGPPESCANVADAKSNLRRASRDTGPEALTGCGDVGDSASARLPNRAKFTLGKSTAITESKRSDWWTTEPDVGGMVDGLA